MGWSMVGVELSMPLAFVTAVLLRELADQQPSSDHDNG